MKLIIENLSFSYSELSDIDNAEEMEEEGSEDESLKLANPPLVIVASGYVDYKSSRMYPPFGFAGLRITRSNDYYYAQIIISKMDARTFSGVSPLIGKKLEPHSRGWMPISQSAEGYIMKNGKIIACLSPGDQDSRVIGIGVNGAVPRKLDSRSEFKRDMRELQLYSNILIQACLEKKFAGQGQVPKTLEELSVHLSV